MLVMAGVGRDVDAAELGLLLRAAEVDHFWSDDDLVVAEDRVGEVGEMLAHVGPPAEPSTTPGALARRTFSPGPKVRAFFVWGPAVAALFYGSAAMETKRQQTDGLFTDLWKVLAVQAAIFVVLGAVALWANWEVRFHRRALWLLVASVGFLAGAVFL